MNNTVPMLIVGWLAHNSMMFVKEGGLDSQLGVRLFYLVLGTLAFLIYVIITKLRQRNSRFKQLGIEDFFTLNANIK